MPRDRANIRVDLWADDDWRSLTPTAQWLYLHLLTAPTLNYVGVADWRPARISAVTRNTTPKKVEAYALELEAARFVHFDDVTEEASIRSFLRHDGALTNPNLWKSIGRDFAAVASARLRSSIALEFQRLRDENPDGLGKVNPWASRDLQTLGKFTPSDTPSDRGSHRGSDSGWDTTTTTSTTPSKEGVVPRKRGTRIPEPFIVTAEMRAWAAKETPSLDVDDVTRRFVNYWRAATRNAAKLDWRATWENWLLKDNDQKPRGSKDDQALEVLAMGARLQQQEIEQ